MNPSLEVLSCPACRNSLILNDKHHYLECSACHHRFPVRNGVPMLMINAKDSAIHLSEETLKRARVKRKRKLFNASFNQVSELNYQHLFRHLQDSGSSKQILVVGSGKQKYFLDRILIEYPGIQCIYSDINPEADTDIICDGHNLPFKNEVFHAVICTAVLEHVLNPTEVVKEMKRVLNSIGLIYTEIPFMQQIHEGAYDFTRYTLGGHKLLMKGFRELDAGIVSGSGTALLWSIEHFAMSFFEDRNIRRLLRIGMRALFFWIKYFDIITNHKRHAQISASCTYYIGQNTDQTQSETNIINSYPE